MCFGGMGGGLFDGFVIVVELVVGSIVCESLVVPLVKNTLRRRFTFEP